MEPVQMLLILYSALTAVLIAVGYWIEKGLIGIYIGWLIATLTGLWLHELLIGFAGGMV